MAGERRGMSTLTKVLLIVGGVVGAGVLVVIVLAIFAVRDLMEDAPGFLEELGEQMESAAVASLGDVSTSFARVVSEAGTVMLLTTEGMVVEPAEEGSGFSVNLIRGGESIGFDLVNVSDYLDRVARGELYFADIGRGEAGDGIGGAVESVAPDWVPVYPDARHSASVSTDFEEFSFGIEVLLADARAGEVLDWYKESTDESGDWSVRASSSISITEGGTDEPGHGSVMLGSGDRRIMVLVAQDAARDSFFVILYKGDA